MISSDIADLVKSNSTIGNSNSATTYSDFATASSRGRSRSRSKSPSRTCSPGRSQSPQRSLIALARKNQGLEASAVEISDIVDVYFNCFTKFIEEGQLENRCTGNYSTVMGYKLIISAKWFKNPLFLNALIDKIRYSDSQTERLNEFSCRKWYFQVGKLENALFIQLKHRLMFDAPNYGVSNYETRDDEDDEDDEGEPTAKSSC